MLRITDRPGRRHFPPQGWIGTLLALLALLFAGCASTTAQIAGDVPRAPGLPAPYVLPFEQGNGSVTVIADDNSIQFVVRVEGLEPGDYEIALAAGGGGAMFGTGNAHVQFGELHGETLFRTNMGELLIWSVHPRRLVDGKSTARIVVRRVDAGEVTIAQTGPLRPQH